MCKEIGTGEILAMKVLKKQTLKEDDEYENVRMENSVLRKIKHPFLSVGDVHVFCFTMRRICIPFNFGGLLSRTIFINTVKVHFSAHGKLCELVKMGLLKNLRDFYLCV